MAVASLRKENLTNLPFAEERADMAAAFRWTARLNMHEAVANHFSLAVSDDGTKFLMNPNQVHFSRVKASDLLLRNLGQAHELVTSFKRVAVDQASDQRRPFDLRTTLEELVATLSPMLRKTPYRMELDLAGGLVLDSYPGPLGQVVTNLVTNALLHAFEGRTTGCMRIAARALDARQIEIVFSDDGIGIAEEHLKRIFDPFFTTKLGKGGSGLGLNIVHNIVTGSLGGKLNVMSRTGEGTTFTLTIPFNAPRGDTESPA